MKMQRKFIVSTFFALLLANVLPAQQSRFQKNHPLSAKDTITDNAIVIPEDLDRNYDQLLFDWNKQFIPSRNCFKSCDDNIEYPDSVYINRLYALPTIMEMAYNQIVRAYIDMYTERKRTQVEYMLARGKYFFPIFEQALDKYNIPIELKYLPVIESALNPTAVSRAGATGLWQFMSYTGKQYDLEVNSLVDERRDPVKATDAAARYLRDMYHIYGDWNLVIAAYNCGPGNVNKAIRRSGGKRDYWEIYPYLPKETRGYVPAFIAANYVMNYYKYHNLCPFEYSERESTDTIHVNRNLHFQQIADVLNIPIEKIREMNPQYKNDIVPGEFRTYVVSLPIKKVGDFISNEDSIYAYHADELFVHRKVVDYARAPQVEYVTKTIYHSVRRGETVSQVARRYGVSSSQIKKWNRLRSNRLKAGRRLAIRTKVRVEIPDSSSGSESSQYVSQTPKSTGNSTFSMLQGQGSADDTTSDDNTESTEREDNVTDVALKQTSQQEKQTSTFAMLQTKGKTSQTTSVDNSKSQKKEITKHDKQLVLQKERVASKDVIVRHKVTKGETLSEIAEKYNVSQNDIKNWNNMTSSQVNVGQEIKINTSDNQDAHLTAKKEKNITPPTYHKVKRGETLSKIALKYNVTQKEIKEWNDLKSSNLKYNQELIVSQPKESSNNEKYASNNDTLNKRNLKKSHRIESIYYSVKRGDTLLSIAEKYSEASVTDIKLANNLKSDKLRVGQKLKIPTVSR